jgi:hypothetical protein
LASTSSLVLVTNAPNPRVEPNCPSPAGEPVISVIPAFANMLVELAHRDGSVVRALMSKSALMRGDDQIALVTFQDLTEQLWADER